MVVYEWGLSLKHGLGARLSTMNGSSTKVKGRGENAKLVAGRVSFTQQLAIRPQN
jgi:hypothetical protein